MDALPDNTEKLRDFCQSLQNDNDELKRKVEDLEEIVRLLRAQRFGRSSERLDLSLQKLSLIHI